MKWYDIAPKDALDIDCTKRPDLDPPRNEEGEICPWPWDPQQLVGVPMGQYHCGYCGAMCLAGVRHPDYTDAGEERTAFMREAQEREHHLHTHETLYAAPRSAPSGTASNADEPPWW